MRSSVKDPELMYGRRWYTLLVLCVSLMVIGLDNTILNVALPTLSRSLHASTSQLQWIVDAYVIVFAGLLLTAGSLGDRFGRYKGLTFGLAIFGIGSLSSALATSSTQLIATRAFMGIGGAFIMPATLSIITNVFRDPVERGKAIGIWAGVSALGIGFGPVVGGFLLTHFWWGSVFLVNVPIVIVGLVAGWFLVPDSRDPSAPKLDPLGALLSITGLAVLLYAVIEAPSHGWTSPSTLVAFGVGFVGLGLFMAWELHYDSPMLDIRFFENPRFTAASAAITMTFFTLFGMLFLLTGYLQSVLGYSTLKAGAILVPQALVMMVVAPSSSGFVRRFGNKIVVAFGLSVVTVTLLLMGQLTVSSPLWYVIFVTALLGVGMGNVMAPATDSIMGALPREKAGVGSAVNDTTRQVGGAAGVAVLGSILSSQYRSTVTDKLRVDQISVQAQQAIKANIGQAVNIAHSRQLAALQSHVVSVARNAYVSAFHTAVYAGAVVTAFAIFGVVKWLPARAANEQVVGVGRSADATLVTSTCEPEVALDAG
ncbi:MAG: MFS transporter [Acidimicrobiales bacterium]